MKFAASVSLAALALAGCATNPARADGRRVAGRRRGRAAAPAVATASADRRRRARVRRRGRKGSVRLSA